MARQIIRHICLSHEREQDDNLAAARDHVAKGLQLDPENRYLKFLRAELAEAGREAGGQDKVKIGKSMKRKTVPLISRSRH